MKCDLPVELLSGYLDGELDEQQKAQVEAHLTTCPACQEELNTLRQMDEHVRDRVYEEPSREFVFTLNRRVMDKVRGTPRSSFSRFTPIFAPAAAALLILIILINVSPSKKSIGLTDRMMYEQIEPRQEPAVSLPEPRIARVATSKKRLARHDMKKAVSTRLEEARSTDAEESLDMDELRAKAPREQVVRAIIDTSGTIIKVATGNTLIPEKDTMLENQLSGQQLAPAMIAGKKQQIYLDFAAEEPEEE
ncbi:MAG: anti-sigma factor [bacterium]